MADVILQIGNIDQLRQVIGPKLKKPPDIGKRVEKTSEDEARAILKQALRPSTVGHLTKAFLPDAVFRRLPLKARLKIRFSESRARAAQPVPEGISRLNVPGRIRAQRETLARKVMAMRAGAAAAGLVAGAVAVDHLT